MNKEDYNKIQKDHIKLFEDNLDNIELVQGVFHVSVTKIVKEDPETNVVKESKEFVLNIDGSLFCYDIETNMELFCGWSQDLVRKANEANMLKFVRRNTSLEK